MPTPSLNTTIDGHIHTKYCNHAAGEMEDYVLSGIKKGLTEIIFLEHVEEGVISPRRTWLNEEHFDIYFDIGNKLKKKYRNQISIKLGVEVGYNPDFTDIIVKRLAKRKWDKIGLSFHYLPMEGASHLNMLTSESKEHDRARNYGTNKIADRYLNGLIKGLNEIPATCLSHLDAVLRHLPEVNIGKTHLQKINVLLDLVKEKGIDLEVNTSGIDFRGEIFPSKNILLLAIDKKIPLALGSDAHKPEDIGRHFLTAKTVVQELY